MNSSKISVRYAKALFEWAQEKNILDKIFDDIQLINEVCNYPELKELLASPLVTPLKKSEFFGALLAGKVQDETLAFINLIIKNGREQFIPAISRRFLSETNNFRGITETYVTTAVPLDKKIVDELESFIKERFQTKVELRQTVDKSIIGGFILKVDDQFIDASVKTKLNKIGKELMSVKSF